MKETWSYARSVSVMNGEIEFLKKIFAAQDDVRRAVLNREWTDFDEKITGLNRLGEEFTRLEGERALLFSALADKAGDSAAPEEKPFYSLVAELPALERGELSRLYGELKTETLKLRALNKTFLAYLNEARTVTAAYIDAVCPARGGKLYTRKGRKVSQDLRSMLFNDRF